MSTAWRSPSPVTKTLTASPASSPATWRTWRATASRAPTSPTSRPAGDRADRRRMALRAARGGQEDAHALGLQRPLRASSSEGGRSRQGQHPREDHPLSRQQRSADAAHLRRRLRTLGAAGPVHGPRGRGRLRARQDAGGHRLRPRQAGGDHHLGRHPPVYGLHQSFEPGREGPGDVEWKMVVLVDDDTQSAPQGPSPSPPSPADSLAAIKAALTTTLSAPSFPNIKPNLLDALSNLVGAVSGAIGAIANVATRSRASRRRSPETSSACARASDS